MGPPSYMRSVFDRKVVMRLIPVISVIVFVYMLLQNIIWILMHVKNKHAITATAIIFYNQILTIRKDRTV